MADRDFGFLQRNERAYLQEEGWFSYPIEFLGEVTEGGGRQAKSRIQNEVAPSLEMILIQFEMDLLALHSLQRVDAETWREWETASLPGAKSHLEQLRDVLEMMIEIAERDDYWEERRELEDALLRLWEDDTSREELYEMVKIREEGLLTILQREGRPEVLEYIGESGPVSLPSETVGENGEPWASFASRELVGNDLATKIETVWEDKYQLTEHGQAVLECWNVLMETSVVIDTKGRQGATERELVRDALQLHELPYLADWD